MPSATGARGPAGASGTASRRPTAGAWATRTSLHGLFCTDFWRAYALVVPEAQHVAAGKEAGLTNHVERFNNTLRQRPARFVRGTLSFRKKAQMHKVCLCLFLHGYNREQARRYNNRL